MADIEIQMLLSKGVRLDEVGTLLSEMYDYMNHHGLMLPLVPDGIPKLLRSIESSLGRTGALVVATAAGRTVGFVHGMLRLTPDYLGSGVVGFVNHTFIREEFRSSGTGSRLFACLQDWFVSKGATSLELQVLTGNEDGIRFWETQGFAPELLQMRKLLIPKH